MRYTGVIYKLIADRNRGFIKYMEDGIEKSVFFRAFAKVRHECHRDYWMDGDEVEFDIEQEERGPIATNLVCICNHRIDDFLASGVSKNDILSGRIQEFGGKLYFIDDKFGVVFSFFCCAGEIPPTKREFTEVYLSNKKMLVVKTLEVNYEEGVVRLKEAASNGAVFRAEIYDTCRGYYRVLIKEFNVDGRIKLRQPMEYKVGDSLRVKLSNPNKLLFVAVD